jgi:DNA-binding HxlR family transcriptional regulator/peroxiredoxin
MSRERVVDEVCGIAHGAAVMGDWWNLLVVREIVRGHRRFDALIGELGVSRKILTERLVHLVANDVVRRVPYSQRPPRYEYELTERGRAFLPVLVSMQDWADRWLLGDGSLSATAEPHSAEAARMRALPGTLIPLSVTVAGPGGIPVDPVDPAATATVLFTYPSTGRPNPHPAGWDAIPGTIGCTLENRLFRDTWPEFTAVGAAVRGVSTQRPEEQAAFAKAEHIPFPLLSDVDLEFAATLRLPSVRIGQQQRLKRLILVVDSDRCVRHVIFPVVDIPAAIDEALRVVTD